MCSRRKRHLGGERGSERVLGLNGLAERLRLAKAVEEQIAGQHMHLPRRGMSLPSFIVDRPLVFIASTTYPVSVDSRSHSGTQEDRHI